MMTPGNSTLSRIWNSTPAFSLLLAIPALPMFASLAAGDYHQLLGPSGEFAARFLIITLMLTPLMMLFPSARWIRWLMKRRRHIGVAAFGYAALHVTAYFLFQGTLQRVYDQLWHLNIFTGLVAFIIFVPLILTSNDLSLRTLGPWWKAVQRLTYVAALAVMAHWLLLSHGIGGVAVHFAPLAVLEVYRIGWNLKWWRFSFGRKPFEQSPI